MTEYNADGFMDGWANEEDFRRILEGWDDLRYHPDRFVRSYVSVCNDPDAVNQNPWPVRKEVFTIGMTGYTEKETGWPEPNPKRCACLYFSVGCKAYGMNGTVCRVKDIALKEAAKGALHLSISTVPGSYSDPNCAYAQIDHVIWVGLIPADRIKLKEDLKEDRT